jgi:hypothetical protein
MVGKITRRLVSIALIEFVGGCICYPIGIARSDSVFEVGSEWIRL